MERENPAGRNGCEAWITVEATHGEPFARIVFFPNGTSPEPGYN